VADGTLEAGLVVLPVDTDGLHVEPWADDEVVYVSADPGRTAGPVTVEALATARLVLYDAHAGWRDPTRRQLAERAEAAGVRLDPWIEVEHVEAALNLVARGAGDTIASRAVMAGPACPPGLHSTPFHPPVHDVIAFVRRAAHPLSPATREFARLARQLLAGGQGALRGAG
jgi:hypothetical protein